MTAVLITILVLASLALICLLFIVLSTIPKKDTSRNTACVGGLIKSDKVDYKSDSANGIRHSAVIRIMQSIWHFIDASDKKHHKKHHNEDTLPRDVKISKEIKYIKSKNPYHTLEVIYPKHAASGDRLPVVIDIHGGGWMYADKKLNEPYCISIAQRGYIVFNLSYRLVPDVTVTDQIRDVMQALKWIGANMGSFPCDKNRIILTGDSAGGMLAGYCAALLESEILRDIFETASPKLKPNALILTSPVAFMKTAGAMGIYTQKMWGKGVEKKNIGSYMDFSEILKEVESMPPTYLITSSGDSMGRKQTISAYNCLKKIGTSCELANYGKEFGKKLPHVFSVLTPFSDAGADAIDKALEFCENHFEAESTVKS